MPTFNQGAGAGTLQINVSAGEVSGNSTRVYWTLYLYCYNGISRNLDTNVPWNVNIGGNVSSGVFAFDFRNTTAKLIASGSTWIGHNAAGYAEIGVSGFKGADGASDIADNVTVSGIFTLPRIPKVPPAPTALGLDEVTPTGFRYRFSGNGDNGSSIIRWEAQVATDTGFTQNVKTLTDPTSGTHIFTGLRPGTIYYARSRGVNAVGNGTWSSVLNVRTLSGAYVRRGNGWMPVEVLVYRSGKWVSAEVLVYRSGAWVAAT